MISFRQNEYTHQKVTHFYNKNIIKTSMADAHLVLEVGPQSLLGFFYRRYLGTWNRGIYVSIYRYKESIEIYLGGPRLKNSFQLTKTAENWLVEHQISVPAGFKIRYAKMHYHLLFDRPSLIFRTQPYPSQEEVLSFSIQLLQAALGYQSKIEDGYILFFQDFST